jgi:iron complex outermembrane receptor protein
MLVKLLASLSILLLAFQANGSDSLSSEARASDASSDLSFEEMLDADLEDLMSISVVTPSRQAQSLLEAPVSTSVLTARQIINSGATSLPEALRLLPGVLVREMVNGQFDVHIRGFDNVPPNKGYPDSLNKSTLILIDGRPVYNHLNGAMLWQELPIDIHDVDRIELVRGPVGSLYGANAATGVIHFITHKARTERNHISWSKGEYQSEALRMRFSSQIDDRTALAGSFHHQQRQRTDNSYYNFATQDYVPIEQVNAFGTNLTIDSATRYPDVAQSQDKTAINLYLDIDDHSSTTRFSGGTTVSDYQGVLFTRNTPLGLYRSEHSYLGFDRQSERYSATVSMRRGAFEVISLSRLDFEYNTFQGAFEYHLIQQDTSRLSVGVSYESARYDSEIFSGVAEQENPALSMQWHYQLTDRWHAVTAVRGDYFRSAESVLWSYSGGLNYRYSSQLNGRFYLGRSYQSPFFVETFFDFETTAQNRIFVFEGDTSLDPVTIDSAELGVRYLLTQRHALDWEVFASHVDHYADISTQTELVAGQVLIDSTFENINTEALQLGTTISVQSRWWSDLTSHVYLTVQTTDLEDAVEFTGELDDRDHESTPTVYGGAVLDYQFAEQWHLNLNGYYLANQSFDYRDVDEANSRKSDYSDDANWILNAKLSYRANQYTTLFINGRNLVNSRQPQMQYLDHLNSLWMAGVAVDF